MNLKIIRKIVEQYFKRKLQKSCNNENNYHSSSNNNQNNNKNDNNYNNENSNNNNNNNDNDYNDNNNNNNNNDNNNKNDYGIETIKATMVQKHFPKKSHEECAYVTLTISVTLHELILPNLM